MQHSTLPTAAAAYFLRRVLECDGNIIVLGLGRNKDKARQMTQAMAL